ncbi:MAG: hypothetical protein WAW42_02595 [Candidatus Competibacteraceae bacterium]
MRIVSALLIAGLAGCQIPPAAVEPSLYPQRDLTAAWSERHYWRLPEGYLMSTPIAPPVVTVPSDSLADTR